MSFWRISKKDPRKRGRYPSRRSDRRCVIYFVSKFPVVTCEQMSIWLFFPCFSTKSWPFSVGCWRFRKKDPPVTGKLPLFFHTERINLRHMLENERYPSPLGRFRKGQVLTESLESYPNVSGSPQPAPSPLGRKGKQTEVGPGPAALLRGAERRPMPRDRGGGGEQRPAGRIWARCRSLPGSWT